MLSVLWLAFESLVRIFRDRRDLIFAKFVLRQQLTVVRTEYLAGTGYLMLARSADRISLIRSFNDSTSRNDGP